MDFMAILTKIVAFLCSFLIRIFEVGQVYIYESLKFFQGIDVFIASAVIDNGNTESALYRFQRRYKCGNIILQRVKKV